MRLALNQTRIQCVLWLTGLFTLMAVCSAQQPATNPTPAKAASTNAAKAPVLGAVRFLNGDTLRGETLSIDASRQVRWQNPDIKSQIEFSLGDVSSIRLPASPTPVNNAEDNCQIRLFNNDEFRGTLVAMDDDKLVLKTWYAGPLTFVRDSVRLVRLSAGEQFLYHGPTGLDGWTISESVEQTDGEDAWGYAKGVFFARRGGGIARDFKLPDRGAIDFEVAWREFLQLTVTIYTESLRVYRLPGAMAAGIVVNGVPQQQPQQTQTGAGFYALHLNYNTAHLMTVRKTGEIVTSPVEMISGLEQRNRAKFGIRADKAQKTISLLLDGKLVKTWQEPDAWAGMGTAMRLVQQGAAPLNLSNIRVAQWDGTLEQPAIGTNAPGSTNDFIQLKNQDSLAGKVEAIRDGALVVNSTLGPLKIPLDRISQFDVAGGETKLPSGTNGAVRAYFAGGGSITFNLEEWTERGLLVTSPHFGKAQFNPAAFASLEFNTPKQAASAAQ